MIYNERGNVFLEDRYRFRPELDGPVESLRALMRHPAHIDAKQRQRQWLAGYQVVTAKVVGSDGDGGIAHPLARVTLPEVGRAELKL